MEPLNNEHVGMAAILSVCPLFRGRKCIGEFTLGQKCPFLGDYLYYSAEYPVIEVPL